MEENKKTIPVSKQKNWIKRNFWFLVLIGFAFLLIILNSNNLQTNNTKPDTKDVYIGDEAYVGQGKLLARDETIKDKLDKAIIARDDYGISEMIYKGDVFEPEKEVKVLVIDQSSWAFDKEIRILEGKYTNQTGWIDSSFVYKK